MLGFPLPFYRSDTLRLSTAFSPFVYAKVRSWSEPGAALVEAEWTARIVRLADLCWDRDCDLIHPRPNVAINLVSQLRSWKPDVLHVAVPGCMVFAVITYAKLLQLPLVTSYHTHVPQYIKDYTWRVSRRSGDPPRLN